ncbi:MAG: hypothetical protein ACFFCQ_07745, partial [Promethearchaeota archaeon]
LSVSCHVTDTHFLVKLELEAPPSLDTGHQYAFRIDLDGDDSHDWIAFWSNISLSSIWRRVKDYWDAKNIHYVLGNNLIFKLPLREFSTVYEMAINAYAWDTSETLADWSGTDFITVFLLDNHMLSAPTILYPSNGETVIGNIIIQWTNANDSIGHTVSYEVSYSPNNGTDWLVLDTSILTTNYSWDTTAVADGNSYLLNVTAICEQGLTNSSIIGPFTIDNILHTLSTPIIINPSGAGPFSGTITVSWTTVIDSEGHSITYDVYLSNDTGISWILLRSELPDTTYQWVTPAVADGSTYRLNVTAKCTQGLVSSTATGNFAIQNSGHTLSQPTILKPNTGEIINNSYTIEWESAEDSLNHSVTYALSYTYDSGINWYIISTGLITASYIWNTSEVADDTYRIKVNATCSANLSAVAVTNIFTIRNTPHTMSNPIILSPMDGETLNDTITIQWEPATDSWGHSIEYSVYYSPDGGSTWHPLITSLSAPNHSWNTTQVTDGTDYMIKVEAICTEGLTVITYSGTFEIRNLEHTLSMPTILYPTEGTTLDGDITIEWTAAIDSWEHYVVYSVFYSADGGATWTELASALTSTSYTWNTRTVANGMDYLIQIKADSIEDDPLSVVTVMESTFSISNLISTNTSTSTTTSSDQTSSHTKDSPDSGFITFAGIITIFLTLNTIIWLLRRRKNF